MNIKDQAEGLRRLTQQTEASCRRAESQSIPHFNGAQAVGVTGGKGGVGKTNVVVNLAVAAAAIGKKVIVLDADFGLANVDVMLGLNPSWSLYNAIKGNITFSDILFPGPGGIKILPAASGIQSMTELSVSEFHTLINELTRVTQSADLLLVDTSAGIHKNVTNILKACKSVIVVTEPEPTALVDSYALIKVLTGAGYRNPIKLIVNKTESDKNGLAVHQQFNKIVIKFLNVSVEYLGCIPYDHFIPRAIKDQKSVVQAFPGSKSGKSFMRITRQLFSDKNNNNDNMPESNFWADFLNKIVKQYKDRRLTIEAVE